MVNNDCTIDHIGAILVQAVHNNQQFTEGLAQQQEVTCTNSGCKVSIESASTHEDG